MDTSRSHLHHFPQHSEEGIDLERGDDLHDDGAYSDDDADGAPLERLSTARSAIYRSSTKTKWGWSIDIDRTLNPFLLPSPLRRLPPLLARFLGYRTTPPQPLGNLIICFWGFIGIFAGVAVVEVVGSHISDFKVNGKTPIMGSFGASAVLQFYAIESPLAQPRNAILGKVVSTFVGVSMSKLFQLSGEATFERLQWLAGALSTAIATCLMGLTGTVHPPAGAAALIAVTDPQIRALGWKLIGHVVIGAILMQVIALVMNNIQRQFPLYWWTPEELGAYWKWRRHRRRRRKLQEKEDKEKEKAKKQLTKKETKPPQKDIPEMKKTEAGRENKETNAGEESSGSGNGSGSGSGTAIDTPSTRHERSIPSGATETIDMAHQGSNARVNADEAGKDEHDGDDDDNDDDAKHMLIITRKTVIIPKSMFLRPDERLLLESLMHRV